nr:immunoglobulin heavy chain junction region [Mus musculus]NSM05054.1 immunoglobulin heavy chain junction region [Mus musculus]NSM07146.1 immunoglobulin heavy chain junction region [Mus musculus]
CARGIYGNGRDPAWFAYW